MKSSINKLISYIVVTIIFTSIISIYLFRTKNNPHFNKTNDLDSFKPYKVKNFILKCEDLNDSIFLSDIVNKYKVLVLRMPKVKCMQCKFMEFENLNYVFNKTEANHIISILTINTVRDLRYFRLNYDYNFIRYGTKEKHLFRIEKKLKNKPFYFVLNENMVANMIFVPDVRNPILTKRYLFKVKKILFK